MGLWLFCLYEVTSCNVLAAIVVIILMQPADVPVLLIPFRRPAKIKRLIEALALVKPKYIYILGDGPRPNNPEETKLVAEVRRIATDIPWKCTIYTHFKETNVGLTPNVVEGIDWFFSQVPMGIILEDDCIPDPSFFSFCAELLEHYKDDTRIMHISGNNFQDGIKRGDGSYYFSHYSNSWGWATWRRAWIQYHEAVAHFDTYDREGRIHELSFTSQAKKFWLKVLRNTAIWDSRWLYTTWYCRGLCIIPNQNLVSNIGFGADATHTINETNQSNVPTIPLTSITHPSKIAVCPEADDYIFQTTMYVGFWQRLQAKARAIIRKII